MGVALCALVLVILNPSESDGYGLILFQVFAENRIIRETGMGAACYTPSSEYGNACGENLVHHNC